MKTVNATCACGATFAREVKRGRPQKWCPNCVAVPFYERTSVPTAAVTADAVEVEVADRIHNENDALDAVRPEIEERMAVINAEAKIASVAAIKQFGVFSPEHMAVSQDNLTVIQNLYAELAPGKYKPGREFSEDV